MKEIIDVDDIKSLIIEIRNRKVLLDYDLANLYGVETKRINEAVKNNKEKFPNDYLFTLNKKEINFLRSNFSTANLNKLRVLPKAFTEKGLYMLATILKSKKAVKTTFLIIETFTKLNELKNSINNLSNSNKNNDELLEKIEKMITNLIGNKINNKSFETSLEINFSVVKLKHLVKK